MKENVIFCYSGTGNCLDLAKNIAKALGDTDIIMMRKYPAVTDVTAAKRVGFIFPCYGGGLPGHVERYIRDIKVDPEAYTFGITMCAAYKGEGLYKLNQVIPLDYWASVTHQCTCIWLFPHDIMLPPLDEITAEERSQDLATIIADDIQRGVITDKALSKATLNSIEHSLWNKIAFKKGREMSADDKCIQCGQCAKLCPMGNIRYLDKAVIFGDKCIQCMGCLQYCPVEAINVGTITKKRERYHNANVTADELMQEIISY